jgi:ATP-dependent helicase/nuclease subunit B
MAPRSAVSPRLVEALVRVARERPLERKIVVAPTFGGGRELLRRLARVGGGWVGFEVTTPRLLALRLARPRMASDGLQTMDEFDEQALLDEALDGALASGVDGGLGELSEGVGFREAVHGSIAAIRLAGLTPQDVRGARIRDFRKRHFLVRVQERYEALLGERRRADTAMLMGFALEALEAEEGAAAAQLGADRIMVIPGASTRGLTGRFVAALLQRGARVLETDPVLGLSKPDFMVWEAGEPAGSLAWMNAPDEAGIPTPPLDLFRAASITDELREVLRRVVAAGTPWDDVEIITPDPAGYGSALHALSARLGVPVTYAVGLPVERTRPGRAARVYLEWIEGGFQAGPIRRLIESGDLRPSRSNGFHAPADLARRFRRLRIGWGRRRYRTELRNALEAVEREVQGGWEDTDGYERRIRRTRGELEALRAMLFPALKATPSVPDRAGEGGEPVSPAELARGVRAFLRRVPRGRGPDRMARDELLRVLERVEASLRRRTNFDAAVTILRRHLEIRVQAPEPTGARPDDTGAPWRSEGGYLHLSDLEHGGLSGRGNVFVVGLDADRVPGHSAQDPVLTDRDRRALSGDLPTSGELVQERSFRLAALLSRLRGKVTLSYGAWNAAEARAVSPSPVLLQALRLRKQDPEVTFEDLHTELGDVACAIPRGDSVPLDGDDVWMKALAAGGVFRSGSEAVLAAFPALAQGLEALQERAGGAPGAHHGVVASRPDVLDPRRNAHWILSASRLEDLGACPLRYLFRTVLRLRAPEDPEFDPDQWLNALERGSLLHSVYEATLARAKSAGVQTTDSRLEGIALEVLSEASERVRASIPAPGEGVLRRELAGLQEDVRSFVRMVRELGAPWVKLEMRFGAPGEEPLLLPLGDSDVRLRGAVDRVDEDLHGLRIVDYKTGTPRSYEGRTGSFNGGRRLQHAIYAEAAERILLGQVAAGEYHFPTRRGENRVVQFDRLALAGIHDLLDRMLDGVGAGAFVPTDDANDCRFCDFAPVCRARKGDFGKVDSPLADWSKEMLAVGLHPSMAHLKRVRDFEA